MLRVWGFGFRVSGLGSRISGLIWVKGLGFWALVVLYLGFRI